jgi:hypothetical protein
MLVKRNFVLPIAASHSGSVIIGGVWLPNDQNITPSPPKKNRWTQLVSLAEMTRVGNRLHYKNSSSFFTKTEAVNYRVTSQLRVAP